MSRILKSNDTVITQHFDNNDHKGVDMVGENHTTCPVIAHSDGKVEMVTTGHKTNLEATGDATYGNFVKIKHSNGYSTLYAHLDKVYVSKDQMVSKGQEIGYMGNTGRAYGTHVHFEVRKNGTYASIVNPEPYLNADLPGLEDRKYQLVMDWQKSMNKTYKCGLKEDDKYGPDCRNKANKYALYYKIPVIKNEMVGFLQQRLKNLGYDINVDKKYGPKIKEVVKQFQRDRGLTDDGKTGAITWAELLK